MRQIVEFKTKKRLQLILGYGLLSIIVLIYILERLPNSPIASDSVGPFIALVFVSYLLFLVIFTFFNWRCPKCNHFLGRSFNNMRCPHCRVILNIKQSFLAKLFFGVFAIDPTKDFTPQPPPIRLVYDLSSRMLNGISFQNSVSAFRFLGPADTMHWHSRNDVTLLYSNIGFAANLDNVGVFGFEIVMDPAWEGLPLYECSTFYLQNKSGKLEHVGFDTSEIDLTTFLRQPIDRFFFSSGDLCCIYEVNRTLLIATFNDTGMFLRHLKLDESV